MALPATPKPGSIGVAHTPGAMGLLIRVGEAIRFHRGSNWNHAFIVSDQVNENGSPYIIQAQIRGVTDSMALEELPGTYKILPMPKGVNRARVLQFAKAQVGIRYGILTIASIAIDILTWNWFPSFRAGRKQSWICSALAFESLRFGGYLRNVVDIYEVTPAELYNFLTEQENHAK